MERLRHEAQAILQIQSNHVREGRRSTTTIMSADLKMALRPGRGTGDSCHGPSIAASCSRHGTLIRNRSRKRRPPFRWPQRFLFGTWGHLAVLVATLFINPTTAVFIKYQNCLSEAYQNDQPLSLQFVPLFVDAVFNTKDPSHNLLVTVWGNVTGSGPSPLVALPSANDTSYWSNPNNTQGKIANDPDPTSADPRLTTLFNKVDVLTYEPWSEAVDFCDQLVNATCPLGPQFFVNG